MVTHVHTLAARVVDIKNLLMTGLDTADRPEDTQQAGELRNGVLNDNFGTII